jgi:hypothetical protein
MSEKLLPCPFCGGEAKQHLSVLSWVECKHCGNKTRQCQFDNQSIDAWNNRPEPRQLTLDELRQMDGQPVYIVYPKWPDENRWDIIERIGDSEYGEVVDFTGGEWENTDELGTDWIAYDRPQGGNHEND